MRLRGRDERSAGQALVEVSLVVPLFFALLFGILDLGRVIWAIDVVGSAAREGARYASTHAGTVGLTPLASDDDIKAHALSFVVGGGVGTTATVCVSPLNIGSKAAGCTGDVDQGAFVRGNLVTVRVQSGVPVFLGAIFGMSTFPVSAESTVLINN